MIFACAFFFSVAISSIVCCCVCCCVCVGMRKCMRTASLCFVCFWRKRVGDHFCGVVERAGGCGGCGWGGEKV